MHFSGNEEKISLWISQNDLGNFSYRLGGKIVITFNRLKIVIILSAVKVAVSLA